MKAGYVIAVLAATTIAFGASSLYLLHQLRAARGQLTAETRLRVEAESGMQEAQKAKSDVEKKWQQVVNRPSNALSSAAAGISIPTERSADSAAGSANAKVSVVKTVPTKSTVDITDELMKSPDGAAALRNMQKNSVLTLYGDLIRQLQLNPQEADQLIALLTDAQMKSLEVSRTSAGQTMIKNNTMASRKETEDSILALLGQDRFAQYQEYQRNFPEHMSISQLRSQLAVMGNPLPTEGQEKKLFAAMMEEKNIIPRPTLQTSRSPDDFRQQNMQWTDDYDRRVLERAATILSPEQFAIFQDRQQQQAGLRHAMPPAPYPAAK